MHFIPLFLSSKYLTGWLTISANFALSADIAFPTILRSSSTVPGWVENLLRTVPCQIVSDHMVHSIFRLISYHLSHPLCISITRALSISHPVLCNTMCMRACWIWSKGIKLLKIKTGHLYSYVKLNFKASLFSCIFWFEAIFLGKRALLVFCQFRR